eukprot:COSAG04_NODE_6338_length_1353_cov_1.562201_1_plen_177_part_00
MATRLLLGTIVAAASGAAVASPATKSSAAASASNSGSGSGLHSSSAFGSGSGSGSADPLRGALYKDRAQPVDARVADLLAHMTLEEKASQLGYALFGCTPSAGGYIGGCNAWAGGGNARCAAARSKTACGAGRYWVSGGGTGERIANFAETAVFTGSVGRNNALRRLASCRLDASP